MQNYLTIVNIINLYLNHISIRKICGKYKISHGVVDRIIKKYYSINVNLENLKKMNPEAVEIIFFKNDNVYKSNKIQIPYEKIYKNLQNNNPRTNLVYEWSQYLKENEGKNVYQYSQFANLFSKWCSNNKLTPIFPINRLAGDALYSDWTGDTIKVRLNPLSNELSTVYFFVTTIGISSYTYIEAFLNMEMESWIKGHSNAITFYNGVPKYIITDNAKTGVIRNDGYDFVLTENFKELESFYNLIILPAPPRRPTYKSVVEKAVKDMEIWMLNDLIKKDYDGLEDLNANILEILDKWNKKPFQKKEGSRFSIFNELDAPNLSPLPNEEFTFYQISKTRVPNNYCIKFKSNFYSVPYSYIGQEVIIKCTSSTIKIYLLNGSLIAEHDICLDGFEKRIVKIEHMPPDHKFTQTLLTKNKDYYINEAKKIGENVAIFITHLFELSDSDEKVSKTALSIICLKNNYDLSLINNACLKAIEAQKYTYTYVKHMTQILNTNKLELNQKHDNIRGKDQFKGEI